VKGQSTISFSNKVTKNVAKDTKKAVISDSAGKAEAVEPVKKEVEEIQVEETEEESETPAEIPEKSEPELRAEKITDVQIAKYWKKIEAERTAPRVHQEDLSLSEKVLRYFDVSSQYGVSS
jgi:DNA polymerase delta subunit 4